MADVMRDFLVVYEDLEEAGGYKQDWFPDRFFVVEAETSKKAILKAKLQMEKDMKEELVKLGRMKSKDAFEWYPPSVGKWVWKEEGMHTFYAFNATGEKLVMFTCCNLGDVPHIQGK